MKWGIFMISKFGEEKGKNLKLPVGAYTMSGIGGVHIELISNKEAIIDGIKGVLEYDETLVKLNIGRGTVEFWGSDMELLSLDESELCIKGQITKLEFCM